MGEHPFKRDPSCRDTIRRMMGVMSRMGRLARGRVGRDRLFVCCVLLVLTGCSRRATIVTTLENLPQNILFEQGVSSFEEFTPDSYSQAADYFKQAAALVPDNCSYHLHRSESLLFLALERRLNLEEFDTIRDEALVALERVRTAAATPPDGRSNPKQNDGCDDTAFILRLEAISLLDEFQPGGDPAALRKIAEAIDLDPTEPMNWFVRWRLNPNTRRQENAIVRAAELGGNLALIQYELGNYWLIRADYNQARTAFERALELSPGHFRSYIGLAQAISAAEDAADEDLAENLYRKATELAPRFIEGRILLGDYMAGLDETESAREEYTAVIGLNPDYEVAHLRLGLTELQAGGFDRAEPSFERAIEINPSSYQAYYYLGNVWLSRRELGRAKQLYEESLKYVLNFPEALYALGTVHMREGNLTLALDHFERVLKQNRRHADAYFSRAAIRVQREQYTGAIEDYNMALALYDAQVVSFIESIADLEARGSTRKADIERRRKVRIEGLIERTRQAKMLAEDESLKKP